MRKGFTLIEILISIVIIGLIMTALFSAFSIVSKSWQKMIALSDDVHHGDFVMDQLTMALKSAYYPQMARGRTDPLYGFHHKDDINGDIPSDTISWVKVGSALIGRQKKYAGTPHRVVVKVNSDGDKKGITVKSWRIIGQPDDFDSDEIPEEVISRKVIGLDVRFIDKITKSEIEWKDEWKETNRIPYVVELTLYMEPVEDGESPVKIKRMCSIPCAAISWGR